MRVIPQYYQGILQRLRAEVDSINSLFHHQGVKGDGNEQAIRDLITQFIPKRYAVGTGIVIDQHGNQSRQCDIVIYDAHLYPSFLSLTSVHFFPVDIVYAVIEVKTTLDSATAEQAKNNIASVKKLDIIKDPFVSAEAYFERYTLVKNTPEPPLGFIFAYNSVAYNFDTYKQWFAPNKTYPLSEASSLIACLDQGLLLYKDLDGENIAHRPHEEASFKGWLFPVEDSSRNAITIEEFKKYAEHEGLLYPVKKLEDSFFLVDQPRILLFFLSFLSEMLALRRIHPTLDFVQHYLGENLSSLEI